MIDYLLEVSPAVKLFFVFIFVLLLIRLKISLGSALFLGAISLGLWFGMAPLSLLRSLLTSAAQEKTVSICVIVALILILSHSMKKFGNLERLLCSFSGLVRRGRLSLIVLPALIGLLPMPGGAIFSAPLVDELGKPLRLSPAKKTLINYWFRHVWEFSWPLFPGTILASKLASVKVMQFIGLAFPLTLAALIAGYVCILRGVKIPDHRSGEGEEVRAPLSSRWGAFFRDLIPIEIVILFYIAGTFLLFLMKKHLPSLKNLPDELPLMASLILSIGWVWWRGRIDRHSLKKVFLNRTLLAMIYMVMGICAFSGVLSDSGAVNELGAFFLEQKIPIVVVVILLTFSTGLVVGITMGFVGTTFPILISLLTTGGLGEQMLPFLVLGFCSGFCGVLLSPLHACLVLTLRYYNAGLGGVYRRLVPASLILFGAGLAYFAFLKYLCF